MKKLLNEQTKLVAAVTPGTNNGVLIDRLGFLSSIVYLSVGASAGAPTAQGVSVQVQTGEAADGSDLADVAGATIPALTANDEDAYLDLDLTGCGRYIKVVPNVTFTGGATPSIPINVTVALGDADVQPVS